jgi:DNA-binding response OmpR family regulator
MTDNREAEYLNLIDKRILVVEDEPIIACDYRYYLSAVGAKVAALCPSNKVALEYLATHEIDAAVLDYELRDGNCEPVLAWLRQHGTPFVVMSGHSHIDRRILDAPVVWKPYGAGEAIRALAQALP